MPRKPLLGLACKLRDDVHKVTSGQPIKWVMVGELGLRNRDTAITTLNAALTIEKEWMKGRSPAGRGGLEPDRRETLPAGGV